MLTDWELFENNEERDAFYSAIAEALAKRYDPQDPRNEMDTPKDRVIEFLGGDVDVEILFKNESIAVFTSWSYEGTVLHVVDLVNKDVVLESSDSPDLCGDKGEKLRIYVETTA